MLGYLQINSFVNVWLSNICKITLSKPPKPLRPHISAVNSAIKVYQCSLLAISKCLLHPSTLSTLDIENEIHIFILLLSI